MADNFTNRIRVAAMSAALAWSVGASADLDIAQTPLFAGVAVDPNVMFTLDDSGSMQWEHMPDGPEMGGSTFMFPRPAGALYGGVNYANQVPTTRDDNIANFYTRSAANNGVFYNPDITYRPWVNADGTEMPAADPLNALYNHMIPALGGLNLTIQQTQAATWFRKDTLTGGLFCDPCGGNRTYWPITYYNFNGGDRTVRANYTRVQITSTTPATATFTSPGGVVRTRDEEIQNFANWFQYSRSRILAARGGIGRAFLEMPQNSRVGFAAINKGSESIDGVNTGTIISGVRQFSGGNRDDFYELLYTYVIDNFFTPLRRAAVDVGSYFERSDNRGPWSSTPGFNTAGETPTSHLSCRQSYHILMTDGFWNGPNQNLGNVDNTDGTEITGADGETYQYVASDPFRDEFSDTLADAAMEFWKRDLRPDLPNRVPTNRLNPAFWQHVSTFGVGLGVEGVIDPEVAFAAIESGDEIEWSDPFTSNAAKIDDLLHFGLNGRGGFFSAAEPDVFAEELGRVLRDIVARAAATSSVSVASTRLETDSLVFAAEFDSSDWSGNIVARDPFGENEIQWQASATMDAMPVSQRRVRTFTLNRSTGNGELLDGSYARSKFSAELAEDYDGEALGLAVDRLVNYLLGEQSQEQQNGGVLRDRSTALGNIVNSQLVFSGPRDEGWSRLGTSTAGEAYADFVDEKEGRGVLFVGANDGMLHAFASDTGAPLFSFAPPQGLTGLVDYSKPNYNHRFFVDGQIAVADAWNGTQWRTILVGAYGAGGKGVFALDVTNPDSFTQSNVLWEVGADDPEVGDHIGHVYGSPTITRLPGGQFVTIFGNGYNSAENEAALIVLDLFTGDPVGDGAFPVADINSVPATNGLAAPGLWLETGRSRHVERVYAGDLGGHMWRFDVSGDEDAGFSGISLSSAFNNGLLYRARVPGSGNNRPGQPITSNPTLSASPRGGLNVLFGTGKFMEAADRLVDGTPRIESFYALLDKNDRISDNELGSVVLADANNEDFPGARTATVDSRRAKGWKMNLTIGTAEGERVLARPDVIFGRVIFSTFQPVDDPCRGGGIPRIYVQELSAGGGALDGVINLAGAPIAETGAPTAPPTVISPPRPPIGDPEAPDPGFPELPGEGDDPVLPGAGATGDREGWCSDFGYISPNTQQFIRLGNLCDGRQIWRELRP